MSDNGNKNGFFQKLCRGEKKIFGELGLGVIFFFNLIVVNIVILLCTYLLNPSSFSLLSLSSLGTLIISLIITIYLETVRKFNLGIDKFRDKNINEFFSKMDEKIDANFSGINKEISTTLQNTLENTIKNADLVVAGLTDGDLKKIHYMLVDPSEQLEKAIKNDGILLIHSGADINDYTKVCNHFLEKTKTSIYSMSDVDIDHTFYIYQLQEKTMNGEGVKRWILNVNNRACQEGDNTIKIKRIQVVDKYRSKFIDAFLDYLENKDKEDHEETKKKICALISPKLKNIHKNSPENRLNKRRDKNAELTDLLGELIEGYTLYEKYYVNGSIDESAQSNKKIETNWRAYRRPETPDDVWSGEFIIFDEKILVRYDEDNMFLEIMIGKIVQKFVESFNYDNKIDNTKSVFESFENYKRHCRCQFYR